MLATKEVWDQAGKGEMPLIVAAFMTNVAFARFEEIEQRLKLLCDSSNPETLRTSLMKMQGTPSRLGTSGNDVEIEGIENLRQPWNLLLQLKNNEQTECETCTRKPLNISIRIGADSAEADEKCLNMILNNIKQHVQAKCVPTDIVRTGTPLYADIGYFLTHEENDVNCLRCAFGLCMLLDAYKSFLSASQGRSRPPSCRLQALKLTQEAIPSIDAVLGDSSMPCRCYQTLAYHLGNLEVDMKEFLQQKCFDLYFQSPWVSASHMLEMQETLFYYGLRLFSYRHYVGSVVHVYHVLREFNGFGPIPLLEQIRETFSHILFPGGRPSRNFKACSLRYMGGRLRFRADATDHKSGSHHMAIPAHTAKASAGFGMRKEANDSRFAYCKISLFYHIKEKGYHVNENLWNRTNTLAHVSGKQGKDEETATNHHPHRLFNLQEAVLSDFTGPFPIARVNFFQVYMSCVQIIAIISDKTHGGEEGGRNCLCFLDVMLQAADRCKANEDKLQPFGCKEIVNTCKEAMSDVLGERRADEFLWKIF